MKHIQLECKTRGFGYGDILEVGPKKDIPLAEAESLVDAGMAKEYKAPVSGAPEGKRVAELEGANGILTAKVAELEGANGILTARVTELESVIAAINSGGTDGKKNHTNK